jgi:predicted DNA-binding ArsR family transcriptional regulator
VRTAQLDAAIVGYLREMGWVDARTISEAIGANHGKTMVHCQVMRDRGVLRSRWQTAEETAPGRSARVLFATMDKAATP